MTMMMEGEEPCNLGLSLQLCPSEFLPRNDRCKESTIKFHQLFPPYPKEEVVEVDHNSDRMGLKRKADEEKCGSYTNNNSDHSSNSDENGTRKKLRLSKEQSTLLEDSFKEHNTLSSTQKEDLAKKLNLKPRQVEVWFQNRRARTKVKQTEVDYEFLKKYCENLRDENKRLKTELQELRSTTKLSSSPFYLQCSKATTLTLCSLCNKTSEETNTAVIDASGNPNKLYGGFDDSRNPD